MRAIRTYARASFGDDSGYVQSAVPLGSSPNAQGPGTLAEGWENVPNQNASYIATHKVYLMGGAALALGGALALLAARRA
jgi:hypothetical protein